MLLTLTSSLIDLGVLANSTKALLTSLVKDDPTASAVIEVTAPENDTDKKGSSPEATAAENGTAKVLLVPQRQLPWRLLLYTTLLWTLSSGNNGAGWD